MTFWEALGAIAASFGVALGTSFLPVGGGVELYLISTSALLPTAFVGPLVVASAAGSVAAKTVLYASAAKAVSSPAFLKKGGKRARVAMKIQEGPWIRRGVLVLSTTLSVPPYYPTALAAGALRTPKLEFVLIGLIGQTLRFGAIWAIPQIAASLAAP